MESPDGLYQWYIDIWRPMLTGWLGWSEVTVHGAFSAHEADWLVQGRTSEGIGCDRMLASKHEVRNSSTERPC